jgi:predicted RNA-binding Zn-ribbon protein involved in translation (DUF1610 family)
MAKLRVFACPSCGASLSVDEGTAATTKCQFCGNTVIVPEEIRGAARSASTGGLATGAPLKELGNLVRQGNKIAAIKLYRELFGGGLAEAQAAVDRLSMGQTVQVTYMGMPTTLVVDRSPTASVSGRPTVVQTVQPVQPVIIGGSPGRGLGCVMWSVLLTTAHCDHAAGHHRRAAAVPGNDGLGRRAAPGAWGNLDQRARDCGHH